MRRRRDASEPVVLPEGQDQDVSSSCSSSSLRVFVVAFIWGGPEGLRHVTTAYAVLRLASVPIKRTPFVSGSVHTIAPASSENGTASAMPAPNVKRAATIPMTTGARNCTPRAVL